MALQSCTHPPPSAPPPFVVWCPLSSLGIRRTTRSVCSYVSLSPPTKHPPQPGASSAPLLRGPSTSQQMQSPRQGLLKALSTPPPLCPWLLVAHHNEEIDRWPTTSLKQALLHADHFNGLGPIFPCMHSLVRHYFARPMSNNTIMPTNLPMCIPACWSRCLRRWADPTTCSSSKRCSQPQVVSLKPLKR